jgi:hypothetical protein
MARIAQRASVVDQGLLPFRRRVRATVELAVPFAEVVRDGRICLADLVDASLAGDGGSPRATTGGGRSPRAAPDRGEPPRAAPGPARHARPLLVAVDPQVSRAPGRTGSLGHVHWHALRFRRLLPEMDADILVRPLAAGHSELTVDAAYRPPGGLLGVVGDVVLGRFVSRGTVARFTVRLAQAMADATAGHCTAPAPPTRLAAVS